MASAEALPVRRIKGKKIKLFFLQLQRKKRSFVAQQHHVPPVPTRIKGIVIRSYYVLGAY